MLFGTVEVNAVSEADERTEALYRSQLSELPIQQLWNSLPSKTQASLRRLGVDSPDYQKVSGLQSGRVLEEIADMLRQEAATPLKGMAACMGIMLLCALTEGFHIGPADKKLSMVQQVVSTLCLCTALVVPLENTIARAAEIMQGAAGFILLYVPVFAGLLVTAGHEVTAASYYTAMLTAGNAVSLTASRLVTPLMNVMLALAVSSSVSPKMRLSSLCDAAYKIARWVLLLSLSVFVTVLSVQTLVTSSMDKVSHRALRFTVGAFVPVVGNVLGESLAAFSGSISLLKSGAGVFVVIAAAFLILPVLLECIVWQFSLFVLSSAADITGLTQMSGLFKTVGKAAGMLTAALLSLLTVLIISTVIVMLTGQQGG